MKLGLGLYKHQLTADNYRFAKQAGCSHVVAHLANYYSGNDIVQATDDKTNYGFGIAKDSIWGKDSLWNLKKSMEQEGLALAAIENFDPCDWYDVLLDGPRKQEQMEYLKEIIRNVGEVGIPVFGYNFSLAGVWGHQRKMAARGGADTAVFHAGELALNAPIPKGEVWNMTYDANAGPGFMLPTTQEQLWQRVAYFLNEILPVAEQYGVTMAAHPDDPPMQQLRQTPRLVYKADLYDKLIGINTSKANQLEFCMGSIQEMQDSNIYEAIQKYTKEKRIGYVHFRNVKGKVPDYEEAFIDDGDIDMRKAVGLFLEGGYDGVFIPDHTPLMCCENGWYAGMAYALGYMKALFTERGV